MLPQSEISGSFAKIEEGPAVLCDVADASAGVDFPLGEVAQLSLNDHVLIL